MQSKDIVNSINGTDGSCTKMQLSFRKLIVCFDEAELLVTVDFGYIFA